MKGLRPRLTPQIAFSIGIRDNNADGSRFWVRTGDDLLYSVPGGDYGVAWGYSGSVIAPLIERLLDDINTDPIDRRGRPANSALAEWTKKKVLMRTCTPTTPRWTKHASLSPDSATRCNGSD